MPRYKFSPDQLSVMKNNPWLTDREKRVLDLFYIRGWRIEDVAAELDVNRSTINRILHKIRMSLK